MGGESVEGTNPSEKSGQEDLQTTPCTGFVGRALTAGRGGRPHRRIQYVSDKSHNLPDSDSSKVFLLMKRSLWVIICCFLFSSQSRQLKKKPVYQIQFARFSRLQQLRESHSSLQTLNDDAEKATLKGLFLQAFAIENERKFSVDAMVIAWFMVRSV